jgi:hypothetical protein
MDQGGTTVDASTQAIADLCGGSITAAVNAHVAAADAHPGYLTLAEGNAAYVQLNDSKLTDAREWTAETISQAEAEAGSATTRRAFTAQRVRQAIAAWWTGASTAAGRAMVEAVDAAAQRLALGLGATDSPTFQGLTITGTAPVNIPHIHGSIAGNFYIHVRNTSGAPLAAGTAVYVTNSVGDTDRLTVAACDPTDTAKMPAVAILETTLANNGDGDAIILGELRPFNTAAFNLNQLLYVGAGGVLTGSVPTSGIVQAVGTVARVQSNTGTIVVHIGDRLGTAALSATTDFAPAAQGVTNGNSHDHNGGDGAQIAYGSLSGLPSIPSPADAVPLGPGTAAIGSSTDYAREDHVHPLPGLVSTSAAGLQLASGYGTITYAAQVTLNFAVLDRQINTIDLTGALELLTSNLANGREVRLRLVCDATQRALTFPTDWRFVGTKPANIAASKVAVLSLAAFGATNAHVVAAYAVQS